MAARVMGIYTTPSGIAVALVSGARGEKLLHASWHPTFVQPDGSRLYPAEELHKRVRTLAPDATLIFDEAYPVVPLTVSLPKLRPSQVFQALKIELASQSIDEMMDPAVGFCPETVEVSKWKKKAGLSGFGLFMASSDLRNLESKHRPLGITPTQVTLPIFPLLFAYLSSGRGDPALIFLSEGAIHMMGGIRDGRIRDLDVFYGEEQALVQRLGRYRDTHPDARIYGFRARDGERPSDAPVIQADALFVPLGEEKEAEFLVREARPLSRQALAALIARLPFMIGSFDYGGIPIGALEGETSGKGRGARYAAALVVFLLLGMGGVVGLMARVDRQIYREQKETMTRIIKSVMPRAPSLVSVTMVRAEIEKYKPLRRHIAPLLEPSSLSVASRVFPVLDSRGTVKVRAFSASREGMRLVFEAGKAPIDLTGLKKALEEKTGRVVEIKPFLPGTSKGERGKRYELTLSIRGKEGARRAQ